MLTVFTLTLAAEIVIATVGSPARLSSRRRVVRRAAVLLQGALEWLG